MKSGVRAFVPWAALAVLGGPCASAWADEKPDSSSPFVATMRQADGTVRVAGAIEHERENRGAGRTDSRAVTIYSYLLQCGADGPILLGASGRCSKVICTLADGRAGERFAVIAHKVDAETRRSLSKPEVVGIACRPSDHAPSVGIITLIERAFKTLKLPALEVRSAPEGRTFVHLPTMFSVEPPEKDRDLGKILGASGDGDDQAGELPVVVRGRVRPHDVGARHGRAGRVSAAHVQHAQNGGGLRGDHLPREVPGGRWESPRDPGTGVGRRPRHCPARPRGSD